MKQLKSFFEKITLEEVLLWFYVLLLPYLNLPFLVFGGKKILFSDIAALILLCVFIKSYLSRGARVICAPLLPPVITMASAFFISFFLSPHKTLGGMAEVFGILYLVVLFYMVCNVLIDETRLRRFLYVWIFSAFIVSLIGILGFLEALITKDFGSANFLSYTKIDSMAHHFPRVCSTLGVSNMFYTYLHVTIVFAAINFYLEPDRKKKIFLIVALAIFFVMSVLTGSRRIAGLFLTIFLFLFLSKQKTKIPAILKGAALFGFVIFLAAYFITSVWVVFPVKIERQALQKRISVSFDSSLSLHLISHAVSVKMFKTHPVIGVGFGSYNRYFKEYLDWDWVKTSFGYDAYPEYVDSVERKTLNFDPHSLYLGVLAECGLLGFMAVLYFFFSYIKLLSARIRSCGILDKIIGWAIMAGLVGFLVSAATIDILSMRHFWIMLAIGMSAQTYRG